MQKIHQQVLFKKKKKSLTLVLNDIEKIGWLLDPPLVFSMKDFTSVLCTPQSSRGPTGKPVTTNSRCTVVFSAIVWAVGTMLDFKIPSALLNPPSFLSQKLFNKLEHLISKQFS